MSENNQKPADQQQRDEALDLKQSFIVQAPAGSGKTQLLVQRYLKLLTQVKKPEEIVALTFTRKAAAEIRARICNAVPTINPSRLRIMTIDALCSSLTRQMPLLSRFGALPNIMENAAAYYSQAVRSLLMTVETEQTWSSSLQRLLLHLNNDYQIAENLFVKMLMCRDQWLPHILGTKNHVETRNMLEQSLRQVIEENLQHCYRLFPPSLINELLELLRFSANNLKITDPNNQLLICSDIQQLPSPTLLFKSHWATIASFLLTQNFQWRKRLTTNEGFPSDAKNKIYKGMKHRMQALIDKLEKHEEFRLALQDILESPQEKYSQSQWDMISILIEILPVLAAHLTLIFRENNTVDFIEIASAAIAALGSTEAPSDIALNLDYQIQHLLIDEFQDTSNSQFKLLELITAGWQPGDGKTVFLVGDPMQSIYRFREAEVGLFLRAKQQGIGHIKLKSLTLGANFRSQANIVEWLNQTFPAIFPVVENIALGAVAFVPSIATHTAEQFVRLYAFIKQNNEEQVKRIIEIIESHKKQNPKQTIAILVRSRSHLQNIIPALKTAGIKFRGVEIEKLDENPVIQDLFSLTRALLNPADRVAWLAILRAPWCGLALADLLIIAKRAHNTALWEPLINYAEISELSLDAQQRIQRILPPLKAASAERQRQSLRKWIETTWRALGGPACVEQESDLFYAQTFFDLLDDKNLHIEMDVITWLEKKLAGSYAPPDYAADDSLQIMTIHKAKGLEFDTVILPMLEARPRPEEQQLLLWMERPRTFSNKNDLILAPLKASAAEEDPIYRYLRLCESKKSQYENTRLLYVAVTRAKKNLHLLGSVDRKSENELVLPTANSFLKLLWSKVATEFLQLSKDLETENTISNINQSLSQTIRRLKANWQLPIFPLGKN